VSEHKHEPHAHKSHKDKAPAKEIELPTSDTEAAPAGLEELLEALADENPPSRDGVE
jgi:hypothetical protein